MSNVPPMDVVNAFSTDEAKMEFYCRILIRAKKYSTRHKTVKAMSLIPNKENVEITLPLPLVIRYYLAMWKFGFQHGKNDPHCTCMD